MKLIPNKEKKFFSGLTDTSDWEPGSISLSKEEIAALKRAMEICEKADGILRKAWKDPDFYNSFGVAALEIADILEAGS